MKQILPWILVIAFGAATAIQFTNAQKKDLEIATIRAQMQDSQNHGESDGGHKSRADSNEVERLRKDSEEVFKLRNQVAQLQKRLKEMPTALPGDGAGLEQGQLATDDPTATNPPSPPEDPVTKQQREQCITNLKAVEEAKTMWAVANNKQAGDKMTVADITTALPNSSMPLCPAGGVYTLHEVGIPATCSIEAHSLLP